MKSIVKVEWFGRTWVVYSPRLKGARVTHCLEIDWKPREDCDMLVLSLWNNAQKLAAMSFK